MLIKTASPIESQTFSSWELAVRSALKNFHDGLNKVKCKDEPSQKIINHLISLVVKAENAVNTQQTNEKNQLIYTHLSQVHIELNEFVAHTKISHSEFDNYLIDAIRLFNHLTHPKYIEFFFEKNEIKLSKPINVKEKSKFLIKLIKITNDKVLPEFIRSTDSLPDTLYIDEPFIYFKSQEHEYSLLASQIGLTRYISSNQDPFILSLDDSERWTKRQISRITYDYYYTILFHLYNILNKINEISSNESNYETAEKKRNSLLRKLKLASLTSEEVKSYLNNVTKSLGFRSIESLYKNCIALRYQEGKKYFSKKSTFLNNEIAPKKLKKNI